MTNADQGGNDLVVDLDPGPAGARGQLVYAYTKHPDRPRIATSFAEFLDERVAEWESGRVTERDENGEFRGFSSRYTWPGR